MVGVGEVCGWSCLVWEVDSRSVVNGKKKNISGDRAGGRLEDSGVTRRRRRGLLGWYRKHFRALPWRVEPGRGRAPGSRKQHPNPYHVLVSEAMLQQTQVATVIDYFKRFVDEFSTIQALADADEQGVLRAWQGLGYYRRARNLHAAARRIVEDHAGQIPDSVDALLSLPGVGRYTAGAITSIAYGQRVPVVDGNVARVLARWHGISEAVDTTPVIKKLWQLAGHHVPKSRPGDFNQAVMELGALVCRPGVPDCGACPVARDCHAHQTGQASALPVLTKKAAPKKVTHHTLAVRHGRRYLFVQRPEKGLWSKMWELPTAERLAGRPGGDQLCAWADRQLGLRIDSPRRVSGFTHQTTHRRIDFVIWTATAKSSMNTKGEWRALGRLNDLPLAKPQTRAIAAIQADEITD